MSRGALLLLLCLFTFLLGLGRTAIVDSDEAYYAGAGREMVAGGDWITPHYNFEPRLNKPILYYWMVAGTYKVAGVTEWAARFWAALSGVGLAVVAWLVGRRWVDDGTGFVAGAIVATSVGVVMLTRQALPDSPLALFISLGIWSAIEATTTQPIGSSGRPSNRRAWLILSAVSLALGFVTKGPIAIALPALAVGPIIVWERFTRHAGASRPAFPLSAGAIALATAVFLVIAAPWYIAAARANGLDFLKQFFLHENIDRFASDAFNDRREPGFYLGIMAGGLLPWTAYLLFWIGPLRDLLARRRRPSPQDLQLGAWVVGPLLLLSASVGSQPRYVLPCIVPVALLLGRSIWQRATRLERRDVLFTVTTIIAGATLIGFGALVLRARPLLAGVNADWSPAGAFAMMVAGAGTIGASLLVPKRMVPVAVAVAAGVTVVAFNATVLRASRPEPVEQIAAAIRHQDPPGSLCSCGAFAKNLTFYTQLPVVVGDGTGDLQQFLDRQGTALAVTDVRQLNQIEPIIHRQLPRLAEVLYVNPALWQKPQTLLDPDPAKYLQHVILVSNR